MKPFKTVTGRCKEHLALLKDLSQRDQALAMMMFVAGFSAALDALSFEIPDYSEEEAMYLLTAMHEEIKQIEATAQQVFSGVKPS